MCFLTLCEHGKAAAALKALYSERMGFEKIGTLPVDEAKVHAMFTAMPRGMVYAVGDITIANAIAVMRAVPASMMPMPGTVPGKAYGPPYQTLVGIDQVCR